VLQPWQQPSHHSVGDRNFVNVAPLQLSEEVFWIHSARLDEALVTAAFYLDECDLKSACNAPKQPFQNAPASTDDATS
jgi:hypothetical protein